MTFLPHKLGKNIGLLLALAGLAPAAFGQIPIFSLLANSPSTGANRNTVSLAVADVNGDGKPDALVANSSISSLSVHTLDVLLGNGNGGFTLQANAALTGPAGSGVQYITVADINGDGKPDVLAANYNGTLGVLLGTGTGSFVLQTNSPSTGINSGPTSVAVADINGDGKLDALTTNYANNTLGVLLGDGSGKFILQGNAASTGAGSHPFRLAVADVNGDGKPDVLLTNLDTDVLGVLLGNGSGGFTLQANSPSTGVGSHPYDVAMADVNGDGKPDALVANYATNRLGVLLGNGSGGFTLQTNSPPTGVNSNPASVAVTDVNGDGKLDAVVANFNTSTLGVLLGNGNGGFTLQANPPSTGVSSQPIGVAMTDVNGDGKPDALALNFGTNTLGVLLNTTVLATRAALPGTSASLYPNPAHAAATLAATGLPGAAHGIEATLYNALGQAVRHLTLSAAASAAQAELPTAGLPAGIYLVRLAALDAQGLALGALPTQHLRVE